MAIISNEASRIIIDCGRERKGGYVGGIGKKASFKELHMDRIS